MGTAPNSDGLKGQWGVSDPQGDAASGAGSDPQAQQFQAAFQAEQGVANEHLQYTAATAEASAHEALATRRDALYGAFQKVLGKIDRTHPAKGQGEIDRVLADARALSAEAATLHQETEQTKAEWSAREAPCEEAVRKLEELEAWEDAQAAALRGQADAIRTQANERRWRAACTALDALLPALAPVYEEYVCQRDAKAPYEQQSAEQSARLEPLKAAERPSQPMAAVASEADAALHDARGQAEAKDYVAALETLAKSMALVEQLEALANDPQRLHYLATTQAAEQSSEAQPEPAFKTLEADWAAIEGAAAQAQPMADAGDYAGANQALADAGTRRADFRTRHEALVQQKQACDAALAPLQPRLQAVSMSEAQYAKLQPLQQDLAAVQVQMEAAVQAEDFVQALAHAQDLAGKLGTIEQARAELDEKKQAYDTLRAAIETRIAEASKKQYLNLAPKLEEIKKLQGQAAAAAEVGDYALATTSLNDASAKTDAYVTAGEKEVEPAILGDTQNARADAVMKKLPEADQKEVKGLMDAAKSEAEKQYILKGVAAGHTVAELKEFAKKVQGKDDTWMRDHLSVTGSSTGSGVKQQWSQSCNATAAQAVKAQMDPLYALKLHEENPQLDDADNTDGTKMNPKLAAEQKAGLESDYKGGIAGAGKGVATPRTGGGSGRWADDLLNNQSDSTGVSYKTQQDPPVADAMKSIDSGVGKGQPVPIVIGNSAGDYRHYVVVTGMTKGPPKQYTIHDPGSGKTVVRTEAQITGGALNLSGANRITAIENPSAKDVK